MISHLALYKFKSGVSRKEVEAFDRAVRKVTEEAGLSTQFSCGRHVPLPADEEVASSVYSFAAVWEFEDVELLDRFSRHQAIAKFEKEWARPLISDLAIANHYNCPDHSGYRAAQGKEAFHDG